MNSYLLVSTGARTWHRTLSGRSSLARLTYGSRSRPMVSSYSSTFSELAFSHQSWGLADSAVVSEQSALCPWCSSRSSTRRFHRIWDICKVRQDKMKGKGHHLLCLLVAAIFALALAFSASCLLARASAWRSPTCNLGLDWRKEEEITSSSAVFSAADLAKSAEANDAGSCSLMNIELLTCKSFGRSFIFIMQVKDFDKKKYQKAEDIDTDLNIRLMVSRICRQ